MKLDVDRITHENAAALVALGERALADGDATIDLSAVKRVDSSAIALLLAWQRAAQARGRALRFAAMPEALQNLAALYGVTQLLGAERPETP